MWNITIFISKEFLYHAKDPVESVAEFIFAGPDSPDCPDYKVRSVANQIKVSMENAAPYTVIEVVKNFEDLKVAYPKDKDINAFSIVIAKRGL